MSGQTATGETTASQLLREALAANGRGEREQALALFRQALALEPRNAVIHNELGVYFYHLGQIPEARDAFQSAVQHDPGFARALTNLGACHNELKDNPAAIACHEKALALDPGLVDAWANAGKAWGEMDEFEMSTACYRRGLELKTRPDLLRGLAKAYRRAGRYDRSRALLEQSLGLKPNDPDAHFGLALTCFHQEDYPSALREFEWRMEVKEMVQHRKDLYPIFDRPAWRGEDLSNKTLLVHTEQGFGDNLQFARFLPLIKARAGRLVMWCRPGLGKLFSHSFGLDAVSENVFQLPDFDVQLPLLSIPHHLDPELRALDDFTPYLSAPPRDKPLFKPNPKTFNIGLVWGASDSGFDHQNKKIPLQALAPLLAMPGVTWYSLQVGSDRDDIASAGLGKHLVDLGEHLKSFADTAHAVAQLDMVLSCDTSVAHLAGAMGKPLWVMLKKNPDWRWMGDGERTPWYPGARVYRQSGIGDWPGLVRRIGRDLRAHIPQRGTG